MQTLLQGERKFTLCYVTDRRTLASAGTHPAHHGLLETVQRAAVAGIDWIQVREKDLDARTLTEFVRRAVAETRGHGTRILVNDRLDVALAAGAGGVHLGEASLPVETVAEWRRSAHRADFWIGASRHSVETACAAERAGADYVLFGPVFATPSKAAFGAPHGIERLREACVALRIPVLAIGGVTIENAVLCLAAGAAGIAAIRLFQESEDVAAIVAGLRAGCSPVS
jgi:thiamine-phosphate pyrophosphorylase